MKINIRKQGSEIVSGTDTDRLDRNGPYAALVYVGVQAGTVCRKLSWSISPKNGYKLALSSEHSSVYLPVDKAIDHLLVPTIRDMDYSRLYFKVEDVPQPQQETEA